MRSNGWIEPRSRRRSSRLALTLVPVPAPAPVPVPGDAAGCRRQDMGDPSSDGGGTGDGGGESASRATAADPWLQSCRGRRLMGRAGFVIRSVTHVVRWQRRVVV
ncbi:hypothetical protein GGR55DRAFT_657830 [Xylaria sp. FL0064]|nr:hypothetical protein GGR55DRAFT_657830 [Xylaria sp. FL0064]